MHLDFHRSRTPTGKAELIANGECEWQGFPDRAQAVVDHFGMTVLEKVDSQDERMWIARIEDSQFCISWDDWHPEVSIVAWGTTPDAEVERLVSGMKPPLNYATPKRNARSDWERVFWIVAATLFCMMCLLFAYWNHRLP
jgi:uncharacterized protein DUF3630